MNTCMAFKNDGARCTYGPLLIDAFPDVPVPAHLRLCRTHQRTYRQRYIANANTHHTAGCCLDSAGPRRTWCTQPAQGDTHRCAEHAERHVRVVAHREIIAQREAIYRQAFNFFTQRVPLPPWQQVARELLAPDRPAFLNPREINHLTLLRDYYDAHAAQGYPRWWQGGANLVIAYRTWLINGQGPEPRAADFVRVLAPPPPPPAPLPVPELARIARDSQNVHTRSVSSQTNRNVDLILETPDVPEGCRAHELLASFWLSYRIGNWANVRRTIDDVVKWRDTETCRSYGDRLYRRVLHGLFMRIYRIEDPERRKELWQRFYEECFESVGMCCEGHISRLANVLVGFEDDFKPPVSTGEILQTKMAAIAQLDVPLEMKHTHARAVLRELNIPEDQHEAWLDAF